ncbi:MAG: hypothetical protein LBB34_01745, partial [Holosporales bacterium]|nr:hypothetical protein [Holosporales bacterium]
MRCEINKKKLLATTALGLVLAFGIGTTANMVSRRVEAADETGRGLSTIEGVIVQAENLVKETGSTVVMMDNDPNFIPEEDKGAELRGRLDDIKSDAAKFHQSGGSGAYERLNGMIEQAEEHLTRIQELIQGRPKRPADDAVLPPVDLRPSAAPPFDDAEDRVPVSEEDIRQRMQELDGRLQKLAVNFPRDPSTTDMESLRREIEDMWIEFRVIQQQVNTLGMNRKMDDAMQRLWNELERARMTVENIPEPGVGSEPVPQATAEELKNLKKEATQLLGKIDRYKIGGKDTTRLIEKVEVLEARAGGIGAGPLSTKEQGKLEEIKA